MSDCEQELARKITDFRQLGLPAYVPRDGQLHFGEQMVATVIGGRRVGKSYRVLQAADELIRAGHIPSLDQVCPVDFDNPILGSLAARDLHLIQDTFLKLNPAFDLKTPLVFLLDEIHRVPGWEDYVIDLSRNPRWRVVVTGSSAKLLRDQVATALRGKAISSLVYPLSFAEFLRFKNCSAGAAGTKGQADIRRWFDEYLKWGAYPALARLEERSREPLLREYFDTMILKDILQRFNVSKPRNCLHLYSYLLSLIGRPCTTQSAYDFLKSAGFATSRNSVFDYLAWAEDAWLLFWVPIHAHSRREQERNHHKVYCLDWALAIRNSQVWDGSFSHAFENLIFLHLHRHFPRVRYYLTRSQRQEVDFLVSDQRGKPVLAVQVCQDLSLPETRKREVEPLAATAKYFGLKEAWIITMNQQERLSLDGINIHAVPSWRWLMEMKG